jgi:hypothetical protein
MAAKKYISDIEDWFDCVVMLDLGGGGARQRAFASELAPTLPLVEMAASGENARSLKARLRTRALKRPLLIVVGGGEPSAALLADWRQPLKLYLASGMAADSAEAAQLCDLVMGESAEALDTLGLDRDWPGERLTAPAPLAAGLAREAVCARLRFGQAERKRLNIAVLYCDVFTHIETIYEHLNSFAQQSRHNFFYIPVSDAPGFKKLGDYEGRWPQAWDLDIYDVVIWHYVVPAYLPDRIAPQIADRLAAFDGLKVLFVQDEYDTTATTTKWIQHTGIDVMMTCVPPEGLEYVYPAAQHPGVEFFRTLTGYVPEDSGSARFAIPMAHRELRLAYRGRPLGYRYGKLAREKYEIGIQMAALAAAHGVQADIAVDEDSRIYGTDWYRFLGSARATLATESGANVFDFDGSLKEVSQRAEESGQSFEDFHAENLSELDGIVQMNQISPKIFEAIRMRTALVCFEGTYSGVILPDVHFIPLKKDYSNVEEVFSKLEDVKYLEAMTERAFTDVIQSGRYSYEAFVAEMEEIIESRVVRPTRYEIVTSPILRRQRGEETFTAIVRPTAFEHILNSSILRHGMNRNQLEEVMALVREEEMPSQRFHASHPPPEARTVRIYGPNDVVCYQFWANAGATVVVDGAGARITTPVEPWHYAAGVNLDFSGVDFEHEVCWIKLVLTDAHGEFRASLYDGGADTLREEKVIVGGGGAITFLKAKSASHNLLLFRTGQFDGPAEATFLEAEIVRAPRYPAALVRTARSLAEIPAGALDWWR